MGVCGVVYICGRLCVCMGVWVLCVYMGYVYVCVCGSLCVCMGVCGVMCMGVWRLCASIGCVYGCMCGFVYVYGCGRIVCV